MKIFKQVPTFENGKWSYTNFDTKRDWIIYLREQFKEVGKYRLQETNKWQEKGNTWLNSKTTNGGKYTDLPKNSKGYNDFWKSEGVKCERGVIYKTKDKWGETLEHYVSGTLLLPPSCFTTIGQ